MRTYGIVVVLLSCALGSVVQAKLFNMTEAGINITEAVFNINGTDESEFNSNISVSDEFESEVSHQIMLTWTEKQTTFGEVRIMGIPGQPSVWIKSGMVTSHGQSTPLDWKTRVTSHRIALGFQYSDRSILWSDRGFREILKVKLQERAEEEYVYNVTVKRIFSGTSTEVNGIAVDWLAGNVYWTDALYNWITVAKVDQYEVFRHLINTGLDKPMGITVHPAKGYLFWSDWGTVPKIERSNLNGEDRRVLLRSDLDRPMGITVDYDMDQLYWVDDFRDTIERSDLNGRDRASFAVSPKPTILGQHTLFGIAVYKDYLFVTDQLDNSIKVFNKTSKSFIARVQLFAVPYDIMMYDASLQPPSPTSCPTLSCEHLCISQGNGKSSCTCKEGYELAPNLINCVRDKSVQQPIYIYSVGHSICGGRINIPDRDTQPYIDVDCFLRDLKRVVGLAFDASGEVLYYSDDLDRTITRSKLVQGNRATTLMAQTGKVRGMVVDYLNYNLYWADEYYDHIMVSRLDGRYPRMLLRGIGRPRGLAVYPAARKLYWSDSYGKIWEANLDGTGLRVIISNLRDPDGMVVDPKEQRLYYAEGHGIKSMAFDGTDTRTLHFADGDFYRDVTVFQDYYAWTDNKGQINFGRKAGGHPIRGLVHDNSLVSHDVIAYGDYLQPKTRSPCDADNGGCDQLCLPTHSIPRVNHTCGCMFGYGLGSNQRTCESFLLDGHFVMGIDPYHKALYQLDLETNAPFQARALPDAEFPDKFDYDPQEKNVYWVDKLAKVVKRSPLLQRGDFVIKDLPQASDIDALAISVKHRHVYYSDTTSRTIYRMNMDGSGEEVFANSWAVDMMIDDEEDMVYWAQVRSSSIIYRQPMGSLDKEQVWTSEVQVTGLTIDHIFRDLYWCTATNIYKMNLKSGEQKHVARDPFGRFSNIAVPAGEIYITHQDQKSIYRVFDAGQTSINMTELVFARITDLKEYKRYENTVVRMSQVTKGKETFNRLIMIGVIAGAVTLLLIILLVGILLWRQRSKKKIPKSDYKTEAHDNPEYMDAPMPPPIQIPGPGQTVIAADVHPNEESNYSYIAGARTSISSRDSDLPDVVMSKEGLPLGSDLGKVEDLESQVGEGVDPNMDTEQLVKANQVVLDVGNLNDGSVAYKAQ